MKLFNYEKPGKGIDVNAPEKRGFFRFWEMLFEKFSKHLGTSLMHALVSLPFLVILFFIAPINGLTSKITDPQMLMDTDMTLRLMFVAIAYLLWGCGPSTAAYAYICKCYTLRNPVWILSDGFDALKQNFKHGIFVAIINVAIIIFGSTAFLFYGNLYSQTHSMLFLVARFVVLAIIITYTWMQFYIYQIMTTLELKFRYVMKNSFIYSIASLPFNLVFSIITIAVIILCFSVFHPVFAFILTLLIAPLLTRLPIEFHSTRLLKKAIDTFEERAKQKDIDEEV